jgi:hypothetical protein
MKKRPPGKRIWLEAPGEVHPTVPLPNLVQKPRSAHHGLIASAADIEQGVYLVENRHGGQWLVARGVDGNFDIIESAPDRTTPEPSTRRIIAAVRIYLKRNQRH